MFDCAFERLFGGSVEIHRRPDGVAFLKASKELYAVSSIAYMGLNIEIPARRGHYLHCAYSDSRVKHCTTLERVSIALVNQQGLAISAPVEWRDPAASSDGEGEPPGPGGVRGLALPLRTRGQEIALLGIAAEMPDEEWLRHKKTGMRDVKVLGDYFHSHVLRINGYNAESDMLVSARELDCLKWTAAGKTAWEASVILGISERTVRFHLNAAREKLKCATTTQAVAKAIGYQLIEV